MPLVGAPFMGEMGIKEMDEMKDFFEKAKPDSCLYLFCRP
jgi:hypothetical protein